VPVNACAFIDATVHVVTSPFGLHEVGSSAPAGTGRVGQLKTASGGTGFSVVGSTAYVANGVLGLAVVDLSDPKAPYITQAIRMPLDAGVVDVAVDGRYAYVLANSSAWHQSTIYVIDLSLPTMPIIGSGALGARASKICVADSRVHVLAQWYGGDYYIVDVANPNIPMVVGLVELLNPLDIVVHGSFVYIADGGALKVVDVSDPESPAIVEGVDIHASAVALRGSHLYTLSGSKLQVVDVSNPTSPTLLGSADVRARCITVFGTHAYVGGDPSWYPTSPPTEMVILDVGDPQSPQIVGAVDLGPLQVRCITASKWFVYVSGFMEDPGHGLLDVLAAQCE
jgi:hypothetical protein